MNEEQSMTDIPIDSKQTALVPDDHARPQRTDIPGWGADLDVANRPGVPMERRPPRLTGVHWDSPEQQQSDVEILHSSERPGITPLFGTPQPPSGLSGSLRRWAFTHSENDLRHWLLLLLADRVNVVEGLGSDLMKGRVPNVFAEMGGKAAWKHDPAGVVVKGVVAGLAVVFLVRGLTRKRRRSRR
jgi:hypothetical protein